MSITGCEDFATILSNCIEASSSLNTGSDQPLKSALRAPYLETELLIQYANVVLRYQREVDDYAIIPCMSCEQLHTRKSVTRVRLLDELMIGCGLC